METRMIHVTEFQKKKIVVKNNVKNKMIQNLTRFLNDQINECNESITMSGGVHSHLIIPQYDKSNINMFKRHDGNTIPCLVINCEWVQYQDIVNNDTSKPIWRLPAMTNDGKCILCKLNDEKNLDISKIRMVSSNEIILLK